MTCTTSQGGLKTSFESATAFTRGPAFGVGIMRWTTMFEDVQQAVERRQAKPVTQPAREARTALVAQASRPTTVAQNARQMVTD